MPIRLDRRFALACALAALATVGGTCIFDPPPADPNSTGNGTTLRRFQSAQELVDFVGRHMTGTWFGRFGGLPLAAPAADMAEDSSGNGDTSGSFSTTNVQEAGVDESDVYKSDGERLYVARDKTLHIVQANPAQALAELATLELEHRVSELYLKGTTLIALGNGWPEGPAPAVDAVGEPRAEIAIWPPYFDAARVMLTAIDVSNPAAPQVTKSIEFDGSLASSRLIGNRLHLVMTYVPDVMPMMGPMGGFWGTAEAVLPRMGLAHRDRPLIEWSDVYRPDDPMGYNLTTIVTLDADDIESIIGKVGVMADCGTLYASQEALYLTSPDWYEMGDGSVRTVIHKFDFDESGAARYVATGSVPGELLNQFSLGEYQGNLRVATHLPPTWGGTWGFADGVAVSTAQSATPTSGANAVYVLGVDGETLTVLGAVENIASGERLYSARFLGDRGYLVTFRRIDPLFVLDLSNPAAPTITGELKIPGYSDYLHAISANLLLGVGRSVREFRGGGIAPNAMQVSLFDVADPANPVLIEQIEVGGPGSYADVSYNHKAFAIKPGGATVALPATIFPASDPSNPDSYIPSFQGTLLYDISATGIEPAGSLAAVTSSDYYGWTSWKRAAFIEDAVFAVSSEGVRRAAVGALSEVSEVQFAAP